MHLFYVRIKHFCLNTLLLMLLSNSKYLLKPEFFFQLEPPLLYHTTYQSIISYHRKEIKVSLHFYWKRLSQHLLELHVRKMIAALFITDGLSPFTNDFFH